MGHLYPDLYYFTLFVFLPKTETCDCPMKFGDTLTTELDLVCGEATKRHFLDTVMMLGLLVGSLIAGPLGEIFS